MSGCAFRLLLIGLSISVAIFSSVRAETPFDFETTPGKLPKQVVPEEYAIRIVPDVKKFTFTGSETIKLNVRKPVRELVLNAVELQIKSVSVDEKPVAKSAIKLDPTQETLRITLPDGADARRAHARAQFRRQDQSTRPGPLSSALSGARHGREESDARHAIRSHRCAPHFSLLG